MSGINDAPVSFLDTTPSFFASSLPGYRCYPGGVASLRGLSVRISPAGAPIPCPPILIFVVVLLFSAAVEGAVTSVLPKPIVAVYESAQVLTLERFSNPGGGS